MSTRIEVSDEVAELLDAWVENARVGPSRYEVTRPELLEIIVESWLESTDEPVEEVLGHIEDHRLQDAFERKWEGV